MTDIPGCFERDDRKDRQEKEARPSAGTFRKESFPKHFMYQKGSLPAGRSQ